MLLPLPTPVRCMLLVGVDVVPFNLVQASFDFLIFAGLFLLVVNIPDASKPSECVYVYQCISERAVTALQR